MAKKLNSMYLSATCQLKTGIEHETITIVIVIVIIMVSLFWVMNLYTVRGIKVVKNCISGNSVKFVAISLKRKSLPSMFCIVFLVWSVTLLQIIPMA